MRLRRMLPALLAVLLTVTLGVSASSWDSSWAQSAPTVEVESVGRTQVVLKKITGGYGDAEYAWGYTEAEPDTQWTTKRVFMDLKPGETYYFFARFAGDGEYAPSEQSDPVRVVTESESQEPEDMENVSVRDVTKVYDGEPAEVQVTVPGGAYIYYREGTSGDYDLEEFPEYTDVGTYKVGYRVEMYGYGDVTGTVTVKITPVTPTVTLEDKTLGYTGKSQSMYGAKVTGIEGEAYSGTVTYTYYSDSACTQGETTTAPKDPGTYYVIATAGAKGNYGTASSEPAKLVIREGSGLTGDAAASTGSGGSSYTITATCGAGGTLEPSGAVPAPKGKNVSFTAKPEKGYVVDDVLVDGKSIGSVGVYTFRNIQGDHTMEVTFRRTVAETTVPTETATEEPTTAPTTEAAVETTLPQPQEKPAKKGMPIMIPILLTVLAFGAIGAGIYVYKKYGDEEDIF